MARKAVISLIAAPVIASATYFAAFRRSFQRIPESADLPLIPRPARFRRETPRRIFYRAIFKTQAQRAFGRFTFQTLWRSEIHQQILLFALAFGLVISAKMLADLPSANVLQNVPGNVSANVPANVPVSVSTNVPNARLTTAFPLSADVLSIPLILAFSIIVGVRFCFEIPLTLHANWIFKCWLDPAVTETRSTARRLLLFLSLSWVVPLTFASSLYLWGFFIAVVHTCVLICYSILIAEISILNLRKIPFTCSYPQFQTRSPLIAIGYLFAFIILASYLPEYEVQFIAAKWAVPLLYLPALLILIAIRQYRKNMLPMDKELIFEDPQTAWN